VTLHIAGVGTSVPSHRIAQADAAAIARSFFPDEEERGNLLRILYRRSGVKYRHSVLLASGPDGKLRQDFYPPARYEGDRGPTTGQRMERYEAEAGRLATQAARRALADSGVTAKEVTHLITVSCTGFAAPGVDSELIRCLPLEPGVARTHVGFMGCHGALNAFRVADGLTGADGEACVLVCAVELCTLHQQYGWQPEQIVANALFGDGAGAVVACGEAAWARLRARSAVPQCLRLVASGSAVLADSTDLMTWRVGDHGFTMTLSPQIPDTLRRTLGGWLSEWLASKDLDIGRVGAWAIHPGGPRILGACEEALGLGPGDMAWSKDVLAEFGNLSSPTVLFILERLRRADAARPWVMLGFGPGLAIEAAVVG
jgi:alkylresorcinol/alkylpyrone synthase